MSVASTSYQDVQGSGYSRSVDRENKYEEQWSKIKIATVFVVCNGIIGATMAMSSSLGRKDIADWTGVFGVGCNFLAGLGYLKRACDRVSHFVQDPENVIVS